MKAKLNFHKNKFSFFKNCFFNLFSRNLSFNKVCIFENSMEYFLCLYLKTNRNHIARQYDRSEKWDRVFDQANCISLVFS